MEKAKIYSLQTCKKHRNNPPRFMKAIKGKDFTYTQKILLNRAYQHDSNRNPYFRALRRAKFQRLRIRSERREALHVLIPVLINFCDFSLTREYLFEIKTDLATIAKHCGQHYKYIDKNGNERDRYDTVNNAIKMLEEAELITVLREMDKTVGKQKAMRIWLNPEFFLMLGFSEAELRKIMLRYHKYQFINNKLDELDAYHKAHLERLKHSNVADISKKYSLHNHLKNIRKKFLGERVLKYVAQRKPIDFNDQVVTTYLFTPCFKSFADCNSEDEIEMLRNRILMRKVLRDKERERRRQSRLLAEAA